MNAVTEFKAEMFGRTCKGRLMPGTIVTSDDKYVTLRTAQGREFTFRRENTVSVEDAVSELSVNRVATVANSYTISFMLNGSVKATGERFAQFSVNHPKDVERHYTVRVNQSDATCSCPAAVKPCKHISAVRATHSELIP